MTNKTTTTTAARVETVNAAAMPSVTVKYYSYTDAVQGIRDTLENKGWILADLETTTVFDLPKNGVKAIGAKIIGYGLTGDAEKAFYLSRYAMVVERKTLSAEKAAANNADKLPDAELWRELRDALRLFPSICRTNRPPTPRKYTLLFWLSQLTAKPT